MRPLSYSSYSPTITFVFPLFKIFFAFLSGRMPALRTSTQRQVQHLFSALMFPFFSFLQTGQLTCPPLRRAARTRNRMSTILLHTSSVQYYYRLASSHAYIQNTPETGNRHVAPVPPVSYPITLLNRPQIFIYLKPPARPHNIPAPVRRIYLMVALLLGGFFVARMTMNDGFIHF